MGEMADYFSDQIDEQFIERQNEISANLGYDDSELVERLEHIGFYESKFTELVKSISNQQKSGAKLSEKQRWCLAAYLADDNRW